MLDEAFDEQKQSDTIAAMRIIANMTYFLSV